LVKDFVTAFADDVLRLQLVEVDQGRIYQVDPVVLIVNGQGIGEAF